jgi:membrane-bound metal-dependent hydrolase YbcI (DUF457 family)
LKTKINIPTVLMLSVIPDVDILVGIFIPTFEHRGPTHSVIMALIVFIPIFAVYQKRATPYLIALIQHSLIGDFMVGGQIQLLWPITTGYYGINMNMKSQTSIAAEWTLFLISIIIMLKAKDTATLFQPNNTSLILSIPTFALLLPTFVGFPSDVPAWLIPPHLAYIFIFSTSVIIALFKQPKESP